LYRDHGAQKGNFYMEAYKHARVLIVDDNRELCDVVQEMISYWGIKTKIVTDPNMVANQVSDSFYNIVLLDIVMPEKSGFDLVPEICSLSPDTKIIVMTGYADTEKAIRAIKLGVFDFLEKPITMELLSHAVKRALDTQKLEFDLLVRGRKLEEANEQIVDTNKSLSVLARNFEKTQDYTENQIIKKIRSLMIPIIKKLQRDKSLERYKAELSILTFGLAGDMKIFGLLSFSELRIASMIMSGLTSQKIANELYISLRTVETHRKNIRKKLNINNSRQNLRDYLESRMAKGQYIFD
jgi:FixJ family two-component response regulator